MELKKIIKSKITKVLIRLLLPEIKKLQEQEKVNGQAFKKGIKIIGSNSQFWGDKHTLTAPECVEIGENVHINNNSYIRAEGGVSIGDNTHISRNLVLYSINHDFNGEAIPYDDKMIKKRVIIGRNVWIGMNVCITPGTIIGDGAIIGMGTVVSGEVPPLSIVGSQKWRVIGKRDKDHYERLNNERLFGGINGKLYRPNKNDTIEKVGQKNYTSRATLELIDFGGKNAIKKTFINTSDGLLAYTKELEGLKKFQKYDWCPKVLSSDSNSVIIEYFSNDKRLDQIFSPDESVLKEILWSLLDIYSEGYAHCDIHSKNIFVLSEGVKIIDYESITQFSEQISFLNSYDITGRGMESPFLTTNMGLLSDNPFSLKKLFRYNNTEDLKSILEKVAKEKMLNSSITFNSRKTGALNGGRVVLQKGNIYSTFDLLFTKVSTLEGQRNTQMRFSQFEIDSQKIFNKKILDIGSNIGGTLLNLSKFQPKEMVGVEFDPDKVLLANKLSKLNQINNVDFIVADIEANEFIDGFKEKFDLIFCLAVIEHLKKKEILFEKLGELCLDTLYFEGNENTDIKYVEANLKRVGFKKVKYLGFSKDEKNSKNNVRPLWIAQK
jgi:acetyltransferase-like isoleucine patch superfamily enzyme/2-polyprenyl-3-methyl-5-hydroxy-6-metoxy-1,4-benzoquinol methylase